MNAVTSTLAALLLTAMAVMHAQQHEHAATTAPPATLTAGGLPRG